MEEPGAVMIVRRSEVPSVHRSEDPDGSCFRCIQNGGACARWGKGDAIKVMGALEHMVGGDFWCTREVRNMFSVSCACWMTLHHRTDGKYLSHMQSPAIVWFFKVWMALSAALERWLCDSTSCILIPSSSR